MDFNCGNISDRLVAFLGSQPYLPDSIMSNQMSFSGDNFYLSTQDIAALKTLYTVSDCSGSHQESTESDNTLDTNNRKDLVVVIPITFGVLFLACVLFWFARSRRK